MFEVNLEISTLDATLSFCNRKMSSKFNKEVTDFQFQLLKSRKDSVKKDKSNIYKSKEERYQLKN